MFIPIERRIQYIGIYKDKDKKAVATFKDDNESVLTLNINEKEEERLKISEHYDICIKKRI